MSSKKGKKNNAVLLIPGPMGWDIWDAGGDEAARLRVRTDELRALDVDGLPSRDLYMAFPVRLNLKTLLLLLFIQIPPRRLNLIPLTLY